MPLLTPMPKNSVEPEDFCSAGAGACLRLNGHIDDLQFDMPGKEGGGDIGVLGFIYVDGQACCLKRLKMEAQKEPQSHGYFYGKVNC